MKKGNWPRGVTAAYGFYSTWNRLPKVSTAMGPENVTQAMGLGFTRRVRDQCVRGRLLLALFHGLDASEAGGNCPFWV